MLLTDIFPKSSLDTCNECTACWINCPVSSLPAFCTQISSQCYGKHLSYTVALASDWIYE